MNGNIVLIPILAPFIGGIVTLIIPRKVRLVRELLSIIILIASLIVSIQIFIHTKMFGSIPISANLMGTHLDLLATPLSSFILLAAVFLALLVCIYSITMMRDTPRVNQYYTYSLWAITSSAIAILSNNLIMLLVVWGAIAVLLYLLILMGKPGSEKAGYKALIMIGSSDVLMMIGAGIIYYIAGTFTISEIRIPLSDPLAYFAFILLMIGVFTKSGVMPFHTWIPDTAEFAPIPIFALFPAVLDKLLGIYLLIKISTDLFVLIPNSAMSIILMSLGSLSIIAGAGMALMQNNLMKLLAYSTVSQVGYMVLGVGTATPLGLIGAVFHMINNIIYKTGLIFSGGAIEMRTQQTNLGRLGGLIRYMPITFLTTLIAVFSISGIPPLSGFVSKWLVYQSLIQMTGSNSGHGWYLVIFLIMALLGSVLTLAYFLKVLYSVFWGARPKEISEVKEVSWTMYVPMLLLAIFSIVFGVFAQYPLQNFIAPMLGINMSAGFRSIAPNGFLSPTLATILIILGIIIGLIIYLFTRSRKVRTSEVFIGGEMISNDGKPSSVTEEEISIPGTGFYDSIKKIRFLSDTFRIADSKFFDIFEQAGKFIALMVKAGKKIHNGLLQTYLGWLFLGVITIIAIFFLLLLR